MKKETLAQVFSCGFCEISKNTFFYRTPLVTASELNLTKFPLRYPHDLEVLKKAPKFFKEHGQSKCHTAALTYKTAVPKCAYPVEVHHTNITKMKAKECQYGKVTMVFLQDLGNKDYQLEEKTMVMTTSRSYCYFLANTIIRY